MRHKPASRSLSGNKIIQEEVFSRRAGAKQRINVPTSTWIPLTTGAEPLEFVSNGAGEPILVAYPL